MPTLDAPVLECLILEGVPNCPKEKTAIAMTLAMSATDTSALEMYYASVTEPKFKLLFGPDDRAAELEKLKTQLKTAQDEVQRFHDTYDKNPPTDAGRFGVLEVD